MNVLKSCVTLVVSVFAASSLSAQTNTFPSSGNVGIGTTAPTALLQVGDNTGNQALKVGITGNMANSNAEIRNSLSVLGDSATAVSGLGAVAWNFYNAGSSPSWSGTMLQFFGSGYSGNAYGVPAANQGTLLFQNTASAVIATNGGSNIFIAPQGAPSASFLINGNVGIGTTSPNAPLEVRRDTTTGTMGGKIVINNFAGASYASAALEMNTTNVGVNDPQTRIQAVDNADWSANLLFLTKAPGSNSNPLVERMRIASGGNIGIGTTNPTHKLAVNGTIKAKEVIVETTGWSDYVFADDYRLASLSEVEAHIRDKKHLPGIPSAAEVAEHGVSMGDMQARLLAKVEELTLHVIRLDRKVQDLRADNVRLRSATASFNP